MQWLFERVDLPVGDLSRVLLLQVRELDPSGLRDLRQRGAEDALQLGMHRRLGLVRRRLILFRRSQGITASPSRQCCKVGLHICRKMLFFSELRGLAGEYTVFLPLVVEVWCVLFLTQPVCIVQKQNTQNFFRKRMKDGVVCL